MQILAGVGGLFLDIFFQKSMLDRKTTQRHQGGGADLQPRRARGLFRLARLAGMRSDVAVAGAMPARASLARDRRHRRWRRL